MKEITNPALGNLANKSGTEFFGAVIPAAVGIAYVVGFLIFVYTTLIASIKWMFSGGDKALLENARKELLHGIAGVVILASVLAIVKIIEDFFGINILSIDIGALQIK